MQETLREKFNWNAQECAMTYSDRPIIGAPSHVFVSIHEGSWDNRAGDLDWIDEWFSIYITISVKAGDIPISAWGTEILTDQDGRLDFYARHVIDVVHGNYEIMTAANAMIPGNTASTGGIWKFYRPLHFARATNPEPRAGTWWGNSEAKGLLGVSQQLQFIEAQRAQQTVEAD
jgi:hypothetical protein